MLAPSPRLCSAPSHPATPLRRAIRRSGRAALVLLLAATLAREALQPTLAHEHPRWSDDLIALTNLDRTSNGLAALAVDGRLMGLATERSQDMVSRGYFSHAIPPDGRTVFDLMGERGMRYSAAGENLEFNTAPERQTVRYAHRHFMSSPSHRALILSPHFDHLGAGVATGSDQRNVFTVLFLGLGESGPDTRPAPTLASDGWTGRPSEVASARPATVATSQGSASGSLRPAAVHPLGLIEYLVNQTLRLYLGL